MLAKTREDRANGRAQNLGNRSIGIGRASMRWVPSQGDCLHEAVYICIYLDVEGHHTLKHLV